MRTVVGVCFLCLLSAGVVRASLLTGTVCVPFFTDAVPLSASSSSMCNAGVAGAWMSSANILGDLSAPGFGSPSLGAGAFFEGGAEAIATDPSVLSAATGAALGTADVQLATSGPVRNGFIDIFEQMSGFSDSNVPPPMTANIAVGALQASCNLIANGASCTGNLGPPDGNSNMTVQPFTLGKNFTFSASLEILSISGASPSSDLTSGTASATFDFSFLESDGKTPVEVFVVPEPATWTLIIGGLIAVCGFRKKGVRLPLR